MKTKLILLVTLITSLAFGHEGVELGPNGGRILEFSDNETMHGEVTVKGEQFHIAILDKAGNPWWWPRRHSPRPRATVQSR